MKKYFLFSLLVFNICFAFAQNKNIDSLLTLLKTDKEDTNKVKTLINIGEYYSDKGEYDKSLKFLEDASKLCSETKKKEILITKVNIVIAGVYTRKGDYNKSLDLYLGSLGILERENQRKELAKALHNIAITYYHNFKLDESKKYTLKSKAIFEELKDTVGVLSSLSLLGTICYDKEDYSAALNYYKESLEQTEKLKDKSYSAINFNGIGTVYADTKKYAEAISYFEKALAIGEERGEQQTVVTCLLNLGICYSGLNNQAEAIKIYNQALTIAKKIGSKHSVKELYWFITEAYQKQGDYKSALSSLQQFTIVNDSIYNEENSQQINELTTKYESAEKEKEIAELKVEQTITDAQHKRKQLIYASFILIVIIITFFLLSRQRLKAKNDKILLQSEKQKAEDELLHAKKLLDNYTENLIDKNKAIEELQYENEKLKGLKSAELYKEKIDNLDDLNNATILTNEDWEKFKELFEQVYKGFFIRLKDKLPNLTNAEIRLMSLIKLNLDAKQMANMLGVSPNTIKVTKYRLRKKIDIAEQQDLDELVQSI